MITKTAIKKNRVLEVDYMTYARAPVMLSISLRETINFESKRTFLKKYQDKRFSLSFESLVFIFTRVYS